MHVYWGSALLSFPVNKQSMNRLISVLLSNFLIFPFTHAQEPLPACRYDDVPTRHQDYDDWRLTLLDTIYRLPESYAPTDLVLASEAGLSPDYKLRSLVISDLTALVQAANAAGVALELQSAYRSYSYQATVFEGWVKKQGEAVALQSSARPGHSEHQLGTALDFRSAGGPPAWELADWAATPEGAWLAENAWQYGFVMSYPKNKQDITCYIYEPWHYRYVGREVAKAVNDSDLTLREWLWEKQ
jgi:zinc D-Ala-D-Ala carboxypeptidase